MNLGLTLRLAQTHAPTKPLLIYEKVRVAYGHLLSRSCGGLEGPFLALLGTSGPILSSSIQKYTYYI